MNIVDIVLHMYNIYILYINLNMNIVDIALHMYNIYILHINLIICIVYIVHKTKHV